MLALPLAWRSFVRHKRRSLITGAAVAFGLAMMIAFVGLADDAHHRMANMGIRLGSGHVLVQNPDYEAAQDIDAAITFCRSFFPWYNTEHRHSGIAFMTPQDVHYKRATQILETRSVTMDAAFEAHPKRFNDKRPVLKSLPAAVWINPPVNNAEEAQEVA